MKITFGNISDERKQYNANLSFDEAEQVRGDLKIEFRTAHVSTFQQDDVSVPLVVAELKLFIARLRKHGHATWSLCFAPFLDAHLENGSVRLMSGSKDHVDGATVEILPCSEVMELETQIHDLECKFGELKPSQNAIDALY